MKESLKSLKFKSFHYFSRLVRRFRFFLLDLKFFFNLLLILHSFVLDTFPTDTSLLVKLLRQRNWITRPQVGLWWSTYSWVEVGLAGVLIEHLLLLLRLTFYSLMIEILLLIITTIIVVIWFWVHFFYLRNEPLVLRFCCWSIRSKCTMIIKHGLHQSSLSLLAFLRVFIQLRESAEPIFFLYHNIILSSSLNQSFSCPFCNQLWLKITFLLLSVKLFRT
jgi:hypothetical protein